MRSFVGSSICSFPQLRDGSHAITGFQLTFDELIGAEGGLAEDSDMESHIVISTEK